MVVWYSHLLKNFPQFVVIHIVKGFSVVNEAEDFFFFFWNTLDYLDYYAIQTEKILTKRKGSFCWLLEKEHWY